MLIHNRFTGCWQKRNSVHEGRCRQRCLPTRRKLPRRPLVPYVETSDPLRKTDWGRRSVWLVFHVCFREKQQKSQALGQERVASAVRCHLSQTTLRLTFSPDWNHLPTWPHMTWGHLGSIVWLYPWNDMFLPIENGMTLLCWGWLHFVNATHSKFVRFSGFISEQGSGATAGVVLWSLPSTVGYHDTVSCRCSCKCKVWFSLVSGGCPLLFILVFHSN